MGIDSIVISHALEGIASGLSKAEVRTDIAQNTNLRKSTIETLIGSALTEALAQGIEREDIDPTWL